MRLINCLNLELTAVTSGEKSIYFFLIGTTKIYVNKQLVEARTVSNGIRMFKKTEFRYFLSTNQSVDVHETSEGNFILMPYNSEDVKFDYEYLIFLSVLRTSNPKIKNAHVIIESGDERPSAFAQYFSTYMIAANKDVVIDRKYSTVGGVVEDQPMGIVNNRLDFIVTDKELEGKING